MVILSQADWAHHLNTRLFMKLYNHSGNWLHVQSISSKPKVTLKKWECYKGPWLFLWDRFPQPSPLCELYSSRTYGCPPAMLSSTSHIYRFQWASHDVLLLLPVVILWIPESYVSPSAELCKCHHSCICKKPASHAIISSVEDTH